MNLYELVVNDTEKIALDDLFFSEENKRALFQTIKEHKYIDELKKYDLNLASNRIEELPLDSVFTLKDGRKFKKGERVRKRYRCLCLDNGNIYLFNPLAEVFLATGT